MRRLLKSEKELLTYISIYSTAASLSPESKPHQLMTFQRHSIYTQRGIRFLINPCFILNLILKLRLHCKPHCFIWIFWVDFFCWTVHINVAIVWPKSDSHVTWFTGGSHTEASTEVTVSITLRGCSCDHMTLLCVRHLYWGVSGCTVEAGNVVEWWHEWLQ